MRPPATQVGTPKVTGVPDDRESPLGGARLDLMQYWDAPEPPADVDELMETWRSDPQFTHHRYCWESAHDFVEDHFDGRMTSIFEACAVPAMQADLFRLCWLLVQGGIYIDADQGNRGNNERFTDTSARGHLFFRNPDVPTISNNVLAFFQADDPLVAHWLEEVAGNIERRMDGGVWTVTGPGVVSRIFAAHGRHHPLFAGIRIHGLLALRDAFYYPDPEYKSLPGHWKNLKGSIYR